MYSFVILSNLMRFPFWFYEIMTINVKLLLQFYQNVIYIYNLNISQFLFSCLLLIFFKNCHFKSKKIFFTAWIKERKHYIFKKCFRILLFFVNLSKWIAHLRLGYHRFCKYLTVNSNLKKQLLRLSWLRRVNYYVFME